MAVFFCHYGRRGGILSRPFGSGIELGMAGGLVTRPYELFFQDFGVPDSLCRKCEQKERLQIVHYTELFK